MAAEINTGRLNGSTVYLVGAMDAANDFGEGWRTELTPWLHELGINVLNPCDKPFDIALEDYDARMRRDKAKKERDYDELSQIMKEIRIYDLNMVDHADFIIFNLDYDIKTTGSYEEIFWANRLLRPVLVVCKQGKDAISDWLYGTLKHSEMFSTMDQMKQYLTVLHDVNGPIDRKRWKLYKKNKHPNMY